ncbi:hypothetical protein, partial [Citrobacter sp. CK205]|uniref:hypothetical protein n=1 Tax=Citrobacter sp. CK205 TaxID=2985114 RepID=UPI002578F346
GPVSLSASGHLAGWRRNASYPADKTAVDPVSASATGRFAGWRRDASYPAYKTVRRPGKR